VWWRRAKARKAGGPGKKTRKLKRFSLLRLLALLSVYGLSLGVGTGFFLYTEFAKDLPARLDQVLDYRPARASRVYSADGELIGEFYLQRRVLRPLDRIPAHVQNAFIATEDRRFWKHPGFDPIGIARAGWANYRGTGTKQGASTITQQVTRMLMLSNERTLARKAREVILSVRVERELPKDKILYIYLNHVYLGHGAYGVQAAAETYFGKDVEHLTVAEAAMLAGLPKAPSKFSPYVNYERARERQIYVLQRMREDGYLTPAQEDAARKEPMALVSREQPLARVAAPYFVEHIRRWAERTYGDDLLFGVGLDIYTTVHMKKQLAAEAAVRRGLDDLDRRLGFRGPVGHLDGAERDAFVEGPPRPYVADPAAAALFAGGAILPGVAYVAVVTEIPAPAAVKKKGIGVDLGPRTMRLDGDDSARLLRWKTSEPDTPGGRPRLRRLALGDLVPVIVVPDEKKGDVLRLAQRPDVQAALVAVDPQNGDVVAMVGGYDFNQSQFNRATQAKRQAGSSIKPFIYATAVDAGYTELSIVPDAPIVVRTATGLWAPSNYKKEFLGPLTLRTALAKSINTVSVRLTLEVGVDAVVKTMRQMGITSPIPRHISIALGTPDVSLLEMTAAYATFPTGGLKVTPRFVTRIVSGDGAVLLDDRGQPERPQVLRPTTAYVMTDLLRGVVESGTGKKALALGRPAGGKTGTSTGFRDAWFIAFTADLVCGVWVGRDDFTPIGHDTTGGGTALPIWLDFMKNGHPTTPPRDFQPPPDVIFVRAFDTTGMPAPPGAPGSAWVPFARGTLPPRFTSSVSGADFARDPGAFGNPVGPQTVKP
jgi:penicillin-binding protein 1A